LALPGEPENRGLRDWLGDIWAVGLLVSLYEASERLSFRMTVSSAAAKQNL
jgi:hypothetical protein